MLYLSSLLTRSLACDTVLQALLIGSMQCQGLLALSASVKDTLWCQASTLVTSALVSTKQNALWRALYSFGVLLAVLTWDVLVMVFHAQPNIII